MILRLARVQFVMKTNVRYHPILKVWTALPVIVIPAEVGRGQDIITARFPLNVLFATKIAGRQPLIPRLLIVSPVILIRVGVGEVPAMVTTHPLPRVPFATKTVGPHHLTCKYRSSIV